MASRIVDAASAEELDRVWASWQRGRVAVLLWDESTESCRLARRAFEEVAEDAPSGMRLVAVRGEALARKLADTDLPTVLVLQDGDVRLKLIGVRESAFAYTLLLERAVLGLNDPERE
jgi:hypothetical protein